MAIWIAQTKKWKRDGVTWIVDQFVCYLGVDQVFGVRVRDMSILRRQSWSSKPNPRCSKKNAVCNLLLKVHLACFLGYSLRKHPPGVLGTRMVPGGELVF